ncbi:hypothetical protein K439DRAFT_632506 [Ramaria rubella]|nr:hypothetical protein K439DRAFT_632506 [Ramaria rubella]
MMSQYLHSNVQRPNKDTNPVEWNKSWERQLASQYRPDIPRVPLLTTSDVATALMSDTDVHQTGLKVMQINICVLQQDLAKSVAQETAANDFDKKWKELSQEQREKFILEGIVRAASAGPDMERFRTWCPEITIPYLNADDGRGYLELLHKLIPEDISKPVAVPKCIPHLVFDKLFPDLNISPGAVVMTNQVRFSRCYFISLALWNIFLSFGGKKEMYRYVKSPRSQPSGQLRTMKKLFGKDDARQMYKANKEIDKHTSGQKALKACSRCKEVGLCVQYCSSECQKEDWRNGRPPHKTICGKNISAVNATEEITRQIQDDRIPPPDPTFQRSIALRHQITFLSSPPYPDYVLIFPSPHPDKGISCSSLTARLVFLVMRRRALKSGDPNAVYAMFRLLLPFIERLDFSPQSLKKQLGAEYGVTLEDDWIDSATSPTTEELNLAQKWMGPGP